MSNGQYRLDTEALNLTNLAEGEAEAAFQSALDQIHARFEELGEDHRVRDSKAKITLTISIRKAYETGAVVVEVGSSVTLPNRPKKSAAVLDIGGRFMTQPNLQEELPLPQAPLWDRQELRPDGEVVGFTVPTHMRK